MAINFPTGATPNQIYSYNGLNWIYTGSYWKTYPQFTDILPFTGGTFNKNTETLTLNNVVNSSISVSGFSDFVVTGVSFSNNSLTIRQSNNNNPSTSINSFTGLSVNGTLSASTISGGTLFGSGNNITGVGIEWDYRNGSSQSFSINGFSIGNGSTPPYYLNTLAAAPLLIQKNMTITSLSFVNINVVSGNCVFGLYDSSAGLPNNLLVQSTPFNLNVGFATPVYNFPTPLTIKKGLYFLAWSCNAIPTTRVRGNTSAASILGNDTNGSNGTIHKSYTYDGTLPANFGGGLSFPTNEPPIPHVRFSIQVQY